MRKFEIKIRLQKCSGATMVIVRDKIRIVKHSQFKDVPDAFKTKFIPEIVAQLDAEFREHHAGTKQ